MAIATNGMVGGNVLPGAKEQEKRDFVSETEALTKLVKAEMDQGNFLSPRFLKLYILSVEKRLDILQEPTPKDGTRLLLSKAKHEFSKLRLEEDFDNNMTLKKEEGWDYLNEKLGENNVLMLQCTHFLNERIKEVPENIYPEHYESLKATLDYISPARDNPSVEI